MARADMVPKDTTKIQAAWICVKQIQACEREFDRIQRVTTMPRHFEDAEYWLREMVRHARDADRLIGEAVGVPKGS